MARIQAQRRWLPDSEPQPIFGRTDLPRENTHIRESPRELASELASELTSVHDTSPPTPAQVQADHITLLRLAHYITKTLGIRMPVNKFTMLRSRLQRRIHALHLPSLQAYEKYFFDIDHQKQEAQHFIDVVTTNKTEFFRESSHFEFLTSVVLPHLARDLGEPSPWRIRLWCAGCSCGPEAYTLAMVLNEYVMSRSNTQYSVLATDVSAKMVEQAILAIYKEEFAENVPSGLRRRYLMRSKDPEQHLVRVVPELRKSVVFSLLNFMHRNYNLRELFDVIFFRNVMIYFDKATQQDVLRRLCSHLRPGGFLFISHTESLVGLDLPLRSVGPSVFRKA